MKTLKILTLISLFFILIFNNFNLYSQKNNSETNAITNDSMLLYKTEMLSIIPIKSNETEIVVDSTSRGIDFVSFHLINFDKKYVQHFTLSKDNNYWENLKFPFTNKQKINEERTDFICLSSEGKEYRISYIENEKGKSFVYSFSKKEIIYYPKATEVSIEILNKLNNTDKKRRDSIWVLKSDIIKTIKFDSNKKQDSTITKTLNYHIINFSTSEITLFFNYKDKNWESKSFEYFATKESKESIEFDTKSSVCQKVYLDTNPLNSIIYSFNDNNLYVFSNIKKMDNEEFNKLGIYKWKDSYEVIENSKEIIINEKINNFEYSQYWREEAYKKTIDFIKQKLTEVNPKCKMVSRGYYKSNLVQYIGNQGLKVKIYCEYDCNQNHINQTYFWVEAFYLGYGKWNLELVDQKMTH